MNFCKGMLSRLKCCIVIYVNWTNEQTSEKYLQMSIPTILQIEMMGKLSGRSVSSSHEPRIQQ